MRALSPLALGLALAASAATASAQTVVSRQVTEEFVETTVTQGPYGTVITRRILPAQVPAPVQPWQAPVAYDPAYPPPVTYAPPGYAAPGYAAPPYAAPAYAAPAYAAPPVQTVVEVEPDTIDAVTTRQYVRPAARTVTRATREVVVSRNAPIVARTETRAVRRVQRPVVLSPAERRVVYRTIVQEQALPAAPVVREPAPYANRYWSGPIVAQDDEIAAGMMAPAYAPAPVGYSVGATLPAAVPLYGVPETVAVRVPSVQPYSYAYIGGRVYLVDRVNGVIVADVTQ